MKFLLSERYRLEVRWEKAIYDQDGICKLIGAYFSGPVLSNAQRINSNDHIMLDFYRQYIIVAKNIYVAKLSWCDVVYDSNGFIFLEGAIISHDTELNRVPKLKDTDYLVIDTSTHEADKHQYNLVYKTFVLDVDDTLYNFSNKTY